MERGFAVSVRVMTYDEAATALGRSPEAVRQLCKRKRWKRTIGNDGRARISVPEEDLAALRTPDDPRPSDRTTPGRSPDTAEDVSAPNPDARALLALLQAHVGELQGRVAELDGEVKDLRPKAARVDVLEKQLQAEQNRAAELRELLDRAMTPAPVPSFFDRLVRLRHLLSGKA